VRQPIFEHLQSFIPPSFIFISPPSLNMNFIPPPSLEEEEERESKEEFSIHRD
jgi:hypothetical protein